MTNEEKRFKVEKIEKYKKEIKGAQSDICVFSFIAGLSALLTIELVVGGIYYDQYKVILMSLLSGAGMVMPSLFKLVEAIAKKTHLKLDLDKLKDELKMEEHQEIKRR